MDLKHFIITLIAIPLLYIRCDMIYILPSLSSAGCPLDTKCITLSQITENDSLLNHESNITLLFHPGEHTLISNLTVTNHSNFTMKLSASGFQRPVIICQQSSNFQFVSVTFVSIDSLKFKGCLENKVDMVDKFTIKDSTLIGTKLLSGRALVVTESTFDAIRSSFNQFGVVSLAGGGTASVLHLSYTSWAHITDCIFANNSIKYPAVLCTRSCTGGIIYSEMSTSFIVNSTFTDNHISAINYSGKHMRGGAITLLNSNSSISYSNFTNNIAGSGSAIYGNHDTIMIIFGSSFCYNTAMGKAGNSILGGTVYCDSCKATINSSIFEYNKAIKHGGALLVFNGFITIDSCQFFHNTAEFGGAFYALFATESYIYGDTAFKSNVANYGGAFLTLLSIVKVSSDLSIVNNGAISGAVAIVHSTVTLQKHLIFNENLGSIYVYSGEVAIIGKAVFSNNYQLAIADNMTDDSIFSASIPELSFQGGGITLFVSRLLLQGSITLKNNTVSNGGGILATTSHIDCNCNLSVLANTASDTGGGLYLYQSELSISGYVEINGNRAMKHGGGIHAISAFITLIHSKGGRVGDSKYHLLKFISNSAKHHGGGVHFEAGSKIYVLRYRSNDIIFYNNSADYGGAVYIDDNTTVGACIGGETKTITAALQSECFFQLSTTRISNKVPTINDAFNFSQNHAKDSGENLYGGLLDRCIINAYGKRVKYSSFRRFAHHNILNHTSSEAVRLCPCTLLGQVECSSFITPVRVKKNEKFTIKVAAVDHVNHTVNATILSYVTDNQASLGEEQKIQMVGAGCSNLIFSIVSPKETAVLVVYAEGPCRDLGISPLRIFIKFTPCNCPLGFEQNKAIKNNCLCICHHKLKQALKSIADSDCNSTTLLLSRKRNFWISYILNTTLITFEYCPSDFCLPSSPPIYIDLSTPDGVDVQCKFNRSGLLCGGCDLGLTLSLGSSRCIECPHYWPALFSVIVLSVLLAGIAVVVLMLVLNLTVAKGTLNAMIFYANVLDGNRGLFLSFEHPNFVSVFIAWLNLDIGFDVCFFKGLEMYFKLWLQLAFPIYLILLVVAVIIACKCSSKFAKLVGKRNPVATLATLILLSYARLLHSTIGILSFATLKYTPVNNSDIFKEIMWLSDASIPYLSGKHIPLFIVAVLILLIGVPYTILLTSWQWLIRLPNRTPFKWVRNAKLASFMDAYHAPYVARNRYWTGLLLLARVVLFLTAAINVSGEPRVNFLALLLVIGSLFLLRTYSCMRIYTKWVLDIFEFTTYFNILAFIATKFYFLQAKTDHTATIISVSIGFQFVIFFCTLMHHALVETNIVERVKSSKLYKSRFNREITASPLDNEAGLQESNLVTYSEITVENQCGLTSKEKEREDVMTLFSE